MEIRDPVHNFIDLRDREKEVIDHPAFQRLRRIRQLAMADLVYPGAVHHRFEHSIGVCHIAGRIASALLRQKEDQDRIDYIRMAALVHDIGHGPFSHVSEEPFAVVNREWLEGEGIPSDKVHERIGIDIVRHQLLEKGILERSMFDQVRTILDTSQDSRRTIERDIVSGPLDADKMDYLLRDCLFCGVKYGVYDLERLIRALVVIPEKEEEYIGIHAEDVPVVDQYVIARYNMSLQVYGHKVRRATDLVLTRAILEAIKAQDQDIVRAYTYKPDDMDFIKGYLSFDDRMLLYFLLKSNSEAAQNLAGRLVHRRLPKRIWHRPLQEIGDEKLKRQLIDRNQRKNATEEIRRQFFSAFGDVDQDCVFVEVVDSKPVGKFYDLPEGDLEQIMVKSPDWDRPRALSRVSGFFKDYHPEPSPRLSVYMDVERSERETPESIRRRARDVLNDLLESTEETDDDTQ
jgi:HD superfamily phosphohydrolase